MYLQIKNVKDWRQKTKIKKWKTEHMVNFMMYLYMYLYLQY